MNKSYVLASLVAAVALAACGKQEEAPVAPPAPVVEPAPAPAVAAEPAASAASDAMAPASAASGS
jgi:nitrous oxide reductase accessory protein NosL